MELYYFTVKPQMNPSNRKDWHAMEITSLMLLVGYMLYQHCIFYWNDVIYNIISQPKQLFCFIFFIYKLIKITWKDIRWGTIVPVAIFYLINPLSASVALI